MVIDPRNKALILDRLEPVVPLLHEASEYATERGRSYFAEQQFAAARTRDKHVFATIVRHHLKAYLIERGQSARVAPLWRSNCGVAFALDFIDLLLLKSWYGRLPAPGRSRVKTAFYTQTVEPPLWDMNVRSFDRVNTIVTWDVDSFGNLSVLEAYSPSGGGTSPDSARWHWRAALAHPATTYEPVPDELDDETEEEGEDLDIAREDKGVDERLRDDPTGTESG